MALAGAFYNVFLQALLWPANTLFAYHSKLSLTNINETVCLHRLQIRHKKGHIATTLYVPVITGSYYKKYVYNFSFS